MKLFFENHSAGTSGSDVKETGADPEVFEAFSLDSDSSKKKTGIESSAAWFLDKLNVSNTGMLPSKMMQISEIELNRDLFSVQAKKVTIKA
ncbi:hypothetical protein [Alistipes sp.]|uniref:hypothetical protein n=1 Tax=Alistipes sp. TaxID=1872444 RepID=UPI0025C5CCE5|nr:hypothetical protein [Alistipes sp.]MCI7140339.1 hypothetical protein [Alistipes sp.]MDY5397588.1 hypothetical protein [Alistipes sp.]